MSRFLGAHSYCTALVKMVDDWRLAVDSRKVTGFIAIDLSFKLLIPYVIICFLQSYMLMELVKEAIDFLHSFLTGRKQRVKVNGGFSDWLLVFCGVPQGSLPAPLLFNVFIIDLNFSVQVSSLRLYADDTTTYASNTNISALELSLNQDLENLSCWFASK